MKIQNSYKSLEQEVEDKKNKLTAKSWRGDLSKRGLKLIQWSKDLREIESEVVNKQNVK